MPVLPSLPSPLAVACYDAGAAQHVLAWLEGTGADVRPWIAGPALALWRARRPQDALHASLAEALDGAAAVLSGTGWMSDHEHAARREARRRGLESIAVLDHWVNYPMRFVRGGETVLPDRLWVADEWALAEARRCFPGARVEQLPNRWLETQAAEIAPVPLADDLLVVMEPIRERWHADQAGEFVALDFLLQHRAALQLAPHAHLRIRPHPSEARDKYHAWAAAHAAERVTVDPPWSLARSISQAAVVAGCESAALVVALAAGRRVFSMLPPEAGPLRLPHRGIVQLRELAAMPAAVAA